MIFKRCVLVLALVFVGGCVAAEDKKLISVGAAVGQGNLNEWEKLAPAKQKEAHMNLVASYYILDHSINGRELPAWVTSLIGTAKPGN
jgi:hypothetical protein